MVREGLSGALEGRCSVDGPLASDAAMRKKEENTIEKEHASRLEYFSSAT
jgi:hypothetical protein